MQWGSGFIGPGMRTVGIWNTPAPVHLHGHQLLLLHGHLLLLLNSFVANVIHRRVHDSVTHLSELSSKRAG